MTFVYFSLHGNAMSASSPKPWFHIADLFLPHGFFPTACHFRDMVSNRWRVQVISSVRERTCSLCSPSSSCWWPYVFCSAVLHFQLPLSFSISLSFRAVGSWLICRAAPLNIGNCQLLTQETLYGHNHSCDEEVANSGSVCNQMLVLAGKLLSYKLAHKLTSHF